MLSVDRPSTECRPITDRYIGQVSTNYRPSVGEVSAKCRRSVGEGKAISAETHLERLSTVSRRVSTDYRPTIDRYIDRVSTECRPTIDRVSTAISTDISTDISVDITHSKQDPISVYAWSSLFWTQYKYKAKGQDNVMRTYEYFPCCKWKSFPQ